MRGRHRTAAAAAAVFSGALGFGCATSLQLQNYEKVSLGMTSEQVLTVAGKPNSKFRMESTGQGTVIPTPAGKTETWFYKSGLDPVPRRQGGGEGRKARVTVQSSYRRSEFTDGKDASGLSRPAGHALI